MGEYIRGVVVKLHLTLEQEILFKQNYGCTRKTRNELLNKGFVEILSDFYKKFFKNIFLFYFYFNFQRIILESVFLFYTRNFTSIKKMSNI